MVRVTKDNKNFSSQKSAIKDQEELLKMAKVLYMRDDIGKSLDNSFDKVLQLKGTVYRDVKNRQTFSFELDNKIFFLKIHRGIGWKEIIKNLTQFKIPVLGAENEWLAIQKLDKLGVKTMTLAAYGKRGLWPASIESFVMTDALTNVESLESFCPRYFALPLSDEKECFKKALIRKIAWITRQLHLNHMVHRDLYICHFLLDLSQKNLLPEKIKLHLIDLHRVQFGGPFLARYIIKDLAAILFSSLDLPITKQDLVEFVEEYRQQPIDQVLAQEKKLWEKVVARAIKLYRKIHNREPELKT